MIQAPESQQILDQFSREVDDLRTIARLHGLPTGTPDRITALPLRLSQDSRLRSDLTEMVRSLQARDPELGLPEVVSLLLVAVGGPAALAPHRDLAEPVDLTGGFLASLGGWPGSAVEPLIDIDNPPDHDPRLDLAASAYTETLEAGMAPHSAANETAEAPVTLDEKGAEPASTGAGAVTLAEITHALARLERGNLELRLHLDSIDQRICRMEPLLEAVPHAGDLPDPPPPEPPYPSRPAEKADLPTRTSAAGELVHRGTAVPPSLAQSLNIAQQDELDELKEQRRTSLTSRVLAPAKESVTSALPRPASPVSAAAAPIPGAMHDPVSRPRPGSPRRDRFAAAREIPNPAESDPLYGPSVEELAAAMAAEPAVEIEPTATSPVSTSPPVYADLGTNARSPEGEPPVALPAADLPPVPEAQPPVVPDRPRTATPEAVPEQAQAAPRIAAVQSASPLFGTTRTSHDSASLDEDEPQPTRRLPWIAGLVAAAVLTAAGFLYVNGLPSAINAWVSGDHAAVASNGSQAADGTSTSGAQGGGTSSSATTRDPSPSRAGRVLGARESFTPSESVERTTPPTFVPGGVMDGYLVSAPRPNYSSLANLVGLQGKITFEAMISKAGEVEALKVLGGPQGLRDAATEAVRQWQYRPFEVKGRPVEVRTIIRVDVGSRAGVPADQDPLR